MAVILADTDCLIDFLKGRSPQDGPLIRAVRSGTLAASSVTVYELYVGEPLGPGRDEIDDLFSAVVVIPLTRGAAEFAAKEGARLVAIGQLDVPDLLIAGTALERNMPLITRNVRHFERISGLNVMGPD